MTKRGGGGLNPREMGLVRVSRGVPVIPVRVAGVLLYEEEQYNEGYSLA